MMIDPGLQSTLYAPVRRLAELVDQVLALLGSRGTDAVHSVAEELHQRLGDALLGLTSGEAEDVPTRLLEFALKERKGLFPEPLRTAGQALRSGTADTETARVLEELARALEQEQEALLS